MNNSKAFIKELFPEEFGALILISKPIRLNNHLKKIYVVSRIVCKLRFSIMALSPDLTIRSGHNFHYAQR